MVKIVRGDLIDLALNDTFDVIAHGCNCFGIMGAGIAVQMADAFGCKNFRGERVRGDMNKLGCIDWEVMSFSSLIVVNAYTQFFPGKHLDYQALTLCLRKINYTFIGKHIGLPQIGAGIAGGDWEVILKIIETELKDCEVTIVKYAASSIISSTT